MDITRTFDVLYQIFDLESVLVVYLGKFKNLEIISFHLQISSSSFFFKMYIAFQHNVTWYVVMYFYETIAIFEIY